MNWRGVRAWLERTLIYSWLSYRALFFWANPRAYVTSLVVLPMSIGVLFVLVNHSARVDATGPVLGGALLATNNAVMYGLALVITEERWQGTMDLWLATPMSLLRSLLTKAVVHFANGLVTGTLSFIGLAFFAGVRLTAGVVPSLMLCALSVSVSATGIGLLTASFGIWGRDALVAPNAMRSLILVSSGAVVDVGVLALPLDRFGWMLPVQHAVTAGKQVLNGHGLGLGLLGAEVLVGCVWGAVGYLTLRLAVASLRRSGRLGLT